MHHRLLALSALLLLSHPALADVGLASRWSLQAGAVSIRPTGTTEVPNVPFSFDFSDASAFSASIAYALTPRWRLKYWVAQPRGYDLELRGMAVARTKMMPMALSVEYFPAAEGRFHPYVGLGVNLTTFADEHLTEIAGPGDLEFKRSVGLTAHAGVEYRFTPHWSMSGEVGWWESHTAAHVNGTKVQTFDVDPAAIGMSVGYSF